MMPSSFPSISSNGVTDPSSTSLMRVIFSSMTLLRSGDAVEMTIVKIRNIITMGVTMVRTMSMLEASRMRPVRSRSRSPSDFTLMRCIRPISVCASTFVVRRRSTITSRATTCSSHRGRRSKVDALEW